MVILPIAGGVFKFFDMNVFGSSRKLNGTYYNGSDVIYSTVEVATLFMGGIGSTFKIALQEGTRQSLKSARLLEANY